MFVLDGIPTNNKDDIRSDEIESIEVLKDAAAQAIYGARASNGVILVNTKKPKEGPLKVSYSGYFAVEELYKNFDLYSRIINTYTPSTTQKCTRTHFVARYKL